MHGLRIQQMCLVNAFSIPRFLSLDLDFSSVFVRVRVFSDCCFSCLSLGTCDAHIFISSHDRSSTLCSAYTHIHRSTTRCLVGRIVPFATAPSSGEEGRRAAAPHRGGRPLPRAALRCPARLSAAHTSIFRWRLPRTKAEAALAKNGHAACMCFCVTCIV